MKLRSKCFGGLAKLRRLCKDLPITVRKKLYCALIQPHTDYCSVVSRQLTLEQEKKVEMIQNTGMRIILGAPRSATGTEMRQKLQWTTLAQRRRLYALKHTNAFSEWDLHTSITSSRVYQALKRDKLEDLPQENFI